MTLNEVCYRYLPLMMHIKMTREKSTYRTVGSETTKLGSSGEKSDETPSRIKIHTSQRADELSCRVKDHPAK